MHFKLSKIKSIIDREGSGKKSYNNFTVHMLLSPKVIFTAIRIPTKLQQLITIQAEIKKNCKSLPTFLNSVRLALSLSSSETRPYHIAYSFVM
jgi:hypothetical protein